MNTLKYNRWEISKKTNKVSNNNIMIKYDLTLFVIEFQFDIKAIGMIMVVNKTKYIEIPSTPKYIS